MSSRVVWAVATPATPTGRPAPAASSFFVMFFILKVPPKGTVWNLRAAPCARRTSRLAGPVVAMAPQHSSGSSAVSSDSSVPEDCAQELLGTGVIRFREDLLRSAFLCHLACVEEHDPVSDIFREAHLVGDAQHRHLCLPRQLAHDLQSEERRVGRGWGCRR